MSCVIYDKLNIALIKSLKSLCSEMFELTAFCLTFCSSFYVFLVSIKHISNLKLSLKRPESSWNLSLLGLSNTVHKIG